MPPEPPSELIAKAQAMTASMLREQSPDEVHRLMAAVDAALGDVPNEYAFNACAAVVASIIRAATPEICGMLGMAFGSLVGLHMAAQNAGGTHATLHPSAAPSSIAEMQPQGSA